MFEHELPANGDYIEINHSGNDPVSRFFRYNDQFLYKIRPDRSIAISLSIKFSRFWRPCRRVRLSVTEAYRGCHAEVTADIADGRYYPVSTNGPAYLCNAIISARNRNQAMVYNHIRKLNLCIREVDA